MNSVTKYHTSVLRLRLWVRKYHAQAANRAADVEALNRCYDLMRISPPGAATENAAQQANAIESQYALENEQRESLIKSSYSAKVAALTELGHTFGLRAKQDVSTSPQHRFKRWWLRANRYRYLNLDSVFLHAAYDPGGPMFKAFCKASGLRPSNP